jgi:hypothetical protein
MLHGSARVTQQQSSGFPVHLRDIGELVTEPVPWLYEESGENALCADWVVRTEEEISQPQHAHVHQLGSHVSIHWPGWSNG